MRKILNCIEKDFRIFGRSKFSAFITVVIPLLIILLASNAFSSNSLYGVKIGFYSKSYNDITNNLISKIEKDGYKIIKYDTWEKCENSIKEGLLPMCMKIPEDISEYGSKEPVIILVDDSRINIAYSLVDSLKSQVSLKSSEMSSEMLNEILDNLGEANKELIDSNEQIKNISTNIKKISKNAESITTSEIDYSNIYSKLSKSKKLASNLNDSIDGVSELKSEIDNAISELREIELLNSNLMGQSDEIISESSDVQKKLNDLSKRINNSLKILNGLNETDVNKIIKPIKIEINSINKSSNNLKFLLPIILSLMSLFSGIILASILVIKEKKSRARFRNFITPTNDFTFLISTYFSSIIILFFQFSVFFAGLIFITGFPLEGIFHSVIVILFLSSSLFIFLGILTGYLFKAEEASLLTSVFLIFLFLIFSSIIFPIESISPELQKIAFYNPFFIICSAFKKIILFNLCLESMIYEIIFISGLILVSIFLSYFFKKTTKRQI